MSKQAAAKSPTAEPARWEPSPYLVRVISLAVYKERLEAGSGPTRNGTTATQRMIEKDADDGQAIAERSKCFDTLTRIYLRAVNEIAGGAFSNVDKEEASHNAAE